MVKKQKNTIEQLPIEKVVEKIRELQSIDFKTIQIFEITKILILIAIPKRSETDVNTFRLKIQSLIEEKLYIEFPLYDKTLSFLDLVGKLLINNRKEIDGILNITQSIFDEHVKLIKAKKPKKKKQSKESGEPDQ